MLDRVEVLSGRIIIMSGFVKGILKVIALDNYVQVTVLNKHYYKILTPMILRIITEC